MQQIKEKFSSPDQSKYGSLQSCIRTNDVESVGDGTHLTYFEMLGNFSFGRDDYSESVELWHSIITDLCIPVTHITCHPDRSDHQQLWIRKNYTVRPDETCIWSDGNIGGHCCEVFVNDLEVGNLVNPLGHSTDVGFGWERIVQILEKQTRVDTTSLFIQNVHPIVRDHYRTLLSMRSNGIQPGRKRREYVCRKLIRRMLQILDTGIMLPCIQDWIDSERILRDKCLKKARKYYRKDSSQPVEWFRDTFGILPEEFELIKDIS